MSMTIDQVRGLIRPTLMNLKPYSSARDEFDGLTLKENDWVFLDANENPNSSPFNRYPDPHQRALKTALSKIKSITQESIFIGNGSDEAIDLVIRLFCTPSGHNIIIPSPTYGMYTVSAAINDVAVRVVPLTSDFDLDVTAVMNAVDDRTRLLFLCSPNNPTGNLLSPGALEKITGSFRGIIVVDEAYIDFSGSESLIKRIDRTPNLIILQTLSKAWGLAGLRLGMAFANPEIINLLNKIKPPYNINSKTQEIALSALGDEASKNTAVSNILRERERLTRELPNINGVERVFPSDANFLLVKVKDASAIYTRLIKKRVVVRDRSNVLLCDNCLRITIGTRQDNERLLSALATI